MLLKTTSNYEIYKIHLISKDLTETYIVELLFLRMVFSCNFRADTSSISGYSKRGLHH